MPIEIDIDRTELESQTVSIQKRPPLVAVLDRGAPSDAWIDEVAAVPCLIISKGTKQAWRGERSVDVVAFKFFFFQAVVLDSTRRIRYVDPARGTRYFYAEAVRNVAEVSAVWIAEAEEMPS